MLLILENFIFDISSIIFLQKTYIFRAQVFICIIQLFLISVYIYFSLTYGLVYFQIYGYFLVNVL